MNTKQLKNASLQAICISLLFGAVACREDEPASQDEMGMSSMDQGVDMAQDMSQDLEDAAEDMADMSKEDEEMSCEPVACDVEACGMIADGCGGMLDCGACACEAGVPSSPYCGACGLGASSCEGVENGPSTCSVEETALGLDPAQCAEVRFVSTSAIMQGDGSRERPYQPDAIQQALDDLAMMGGGLLVLEAGDYVLSEQLVLRNGVHLLGGATADLLFDEEGSSTLRITPSGVDNELVGVSALDLASKTWLKQLDIIVDDVEAGNDLYAFHVNNSPGLHLEEVDIFSGKIADGADGKAGMPGADGMPGGDAEERVTLARRVGDMTVDGYINGADAGAAGRNDNCRARANGGVGGQGIHVSAMDPPGAPVQLVYTIIPSESGGSNQVGLAGGNSGSEGDPNGQDGIPGTSGMSGVDGSPGDPQGTLVRAFWQANASGQDGEAGQDGTGGSGGGGSFWMELRPRPEDSKPGSSGGGGGAGGCGGTGGTAGLGGGTGFGMLFVDSSGVILDRVTVQGPDAGNGGNGAEGGRGGEGANGGVGSTLYAITATTSSTTPHTRAAGRGGTGGQGGDGGQGGGGAGGSAFGVYCSNTTVEKVEPVMASAGTAGMGGRGAVPAGNGDQVDVFGCW